jgi:acyl-CoA thioester hydrolase
MPEPAHFYRDAEGRPVVETRFRVRYFETDAMRIVHHSVYFTWFEEGRSAFTRAVGYPYAEMEADGVMLAVAEASARYRLPARYDDEVVVSTCLAEFRSRAMTFTYEIRRATDGALLVTGSTKLIATDTEGRTKQFPEALRARLLQGASG